jgi:GTP cyclohydrolase I
MSPNHVLHSTEQDLLSMMAESHISASVDTPMREDAFDLDDETKIQLIEKHFSHIMNILGLDLNDDSLRDTPKRVAKMYVKEIFSGSEPC